MSWHLLRISACKTHHVNQHGHPAYLERFDEVLKFHSPGLAPVSQSGLAWHIRSDGSAAYDRRFIRTFGYYEGLASVVATDGWHHISAEGRDAYSGRYDWCGNFQEGYCAVRNDDGIYHHIVPDGSALYRDRWRYAGDFRDGIAVVQADDGMSTHIDHGGKFLHSQWFVDLDVFHKNSARARDLDGWMHVDVRGQPLYSRRFHAVEPFYNGQARVECFDGALEVINEVGVTIIKLRPARRSAFDDLSGDLVGFWRTQTIGAAVGLGVIDALPATGSEIVDQCQVSDDGSRRLMRALAELGLVVKDSGRWTLTQRGEFLRADHPLTLADAAIEYAGPFSEMWKRLSDALRQNSGWSASDLFNEVARSSNRCVAHHRMLCSYALHDYREVCCVMDLRGDERVVDAGGGPGVLGQFVKEAHPSIEVTVLDRPEVIAMGQSSTQRLHWQSGSLFEPWGIEADVVLLSRVLHDWDDGEARQILRNARAILPKGGRLFIIEMLIPDGGVAGALCDLHLLVATGGRERTAQEFKNLLSESGFKLQSIKTLATIPSVIEGVVP